MLYNRACKQKHKQMFHQSIKSVVQSEGGAMLSVFLTVIRNTCLCVFQVSLSLLSVSVLLQLVDRSLSSTAANFTFLCDLCKHKHKNNAAFTHTSQPGWKRSAVVVIIQSTISGSLLSDVLLRGRLNRKWLRLFNGFYAQFIVDFYAPYIFRVELSLCLDSPVFL